MASQSNSSVGFRRQPTVTSTPEIALENKKQNIFFFFFLHCNYPKKMFHVFEIKRAWLSLTIDQISAECIQELFNKNNANEDISDILRQRPPGSKGFSVNSIKCFCMKNCVLPWGSKEHFGEIVSEAVNEILFWQYIFIHKKLN